MLIEIVNWAKYQPRHDIKSTTWFRLENTFWADPMLTPLSSDGKMVWIVLLALASQKQSGVIEVDPQFVSDANRIAYDVILASFKHFQAHGKIKIPTSRRKPRSRDATDGRTDGTRRTDVTDEEQRAAAPAPSLDEPVNLPNTETVAWDTKAAAWLQKAITLHNPAAKPPATAALAKWATVFGQLRVDFGGAVVQELLVRIFEPDHPDFIVDPFWRINIQSPRDLRKHWNRITAQINNPKPKAHGYAI